MRAGGTGKDGKGTFGTGVALSAKTEKGNYIYGHDGANEPAINSSARINPDNGDAIVALVNGDERLATELTSRWTFWQVGRPSVAFSKIETFVLSGWAVILLLAAAVLIARRKRGARRP